VTDQTLSYVMTD